MAFSIFKKRPDEFDYVISRNCKNCSTEFQGKYCNRCGEKVIDGQERSILNFMESILNAFTFLDGKFFRSLKLLFTKPGQLSRNIADGVQTPYMKMLSLFFVANFFYFFFPMADAFNSSLFSQMNLQGGRSEVTTRMVNERLVRDNISLEDFTVKYEAQSTNSSKLLLILLAIMFSLFLVAVNYSRKIFFFDHLLLALEFYSFHIIVCLVIIPHIASWIVRIADGYGLNYWFLSSDEFLTPITALLLGYFIFRAQIIFYKQKWYWAFPKMMVLIVLMGLSWAFYRMLLFYVTMWWIA